jgi:hypothetical protein
MDAATANPDTQTEPLEGQDADRPVPPLLIAALIPFITAALLKPRFLDPNDNPEELHLKIEDLWTVTVGLILWALIIVAVVAIVFALAVQHDLLNFEKVVFVSMCLKFSLIAIIICNHQHFIVSQLDTVERDLWDARDNISLLLQGIKAMLHKFNDRVSGMTNEEVTKGSDLLKSIGPIAMMLLSKERSMMRWGMAAADLTRKGLSYLGARHK